MSETTVRETILKILENHEGLYPLTTRDLELAIGKSNPVILKILNQLRSEGIIQTKRVSWVKGFKQFHKLSSDIWPVFLFSKCFNCHNKSTIKTCIFHNRLHDFGYKSDLTRVNTKLTKNAVACPWFIPRGGRRKEMPLKKFLKTSIKKGQDYNLEIRNHDESTINNHLLPRYHCLFCFEPLLILGEGFIPRLGSSTFRCQNCESLYKMVYSKKKEKFVVLCAEEKGDLYRQNFLALAGVPSEIVPYSSSQYGIVIPFEGFYQIDTISETIQIANWIGKLSELDYIVTRSKKDYLKLKITLEKDYDHIEVINGEEQLKSPPPKPQEIGLLRLLRELKLLNKQFCQATIKSRKYVLESLKGIVKEKSRLDAIKRIKSLLRRLERYQLLSIKKWNHLDGLAAKALWQPIAELLEANGYDFPGRCLGRYVKDPFKPFSQYYANSIVDSLINGLFLKISENIKEFCTKINFCWDGLPGICHGETHGGVFGFHLDLIEPFKLAALVDFCEAIVLEQFDSEDIRVVYGRRRQALYCINSKSQIDDRLDELIANILSQCIGDQPLKVSIKKYFLRLKNWLTEITLKSHQITIQHHNQLFSYNSIFNYNLWQFLAYPQKMMISENIKFLLEQLGLTPFIFHKAIRGVKN